jgi:hypothetical protein
MIGDYLTDLLVDNRLIVELKAAKALADEHTAQTLGYLRSARIEHGLLMNFGALKFEIRKFALSQIDAKPRRRSGGLLGFLPFLFASFALFRG